MRGINKTELKTRATKRRFARGTTFLGGPFPKGKGRVKIETGWAEQRWGGGKTGQGGWEQLERSWESRSTSLHKVSSSAQSYLMQKTKHTPVSLKSFKGRSSLQKIKHHHI